MTHTVASTDGNPGGRIFQLKSCPRVCFSQSNPTRDGEDEEEKTNEVAVRQVDNAGWPNSRLINWPQQRL